MPIIRKEIPSNIDHITLLSRVIVVGDCWEYRGPICRNGYGFYKSYKAHRVSYFIFNKKPSTSMAIDHICRNRKCINPDHLREVTDRVNNLENSIAVTSFNHKKTHCIKGHEYTASNTRTYRDSKSGNLKRHCRECDKYKNRKK